MRKGRRKRDPEELAPFFCECGRADCFASVWLTGPPYDRLRKNPGQGPRAHSDERLSGRRPERNITALSNPSLPSSL
jgi:hypothetical protein